MVKGHRMVTNYTVCVYGVVDKHQSGMHIQVVIFWLKNLPLYLGISCAGIDRDNK